MVFWLYGAAVAFGPEKFGFCTTLSPRAVIVRSIDPVIALAPPANTSVPETVIPVRLTVTTLPFSVVPMATAVSVLQEPATLQVIVPPVWVVEPATTEKMRSPLLTFVSVTVALAFAAATAGWTHGPAAAELTTFLIAGVPSG